MSSSAAAIASRAASRVKSATSVATWSLRDRAVWSLPPTGPATSVTRRSTAMWMSSSSSRNGKRALRQLGRDRVERRQQGIAVGAGDDVARREHARVGAGLGDVLAPQAPVEAEGAVERDEQRVRRLGEARHAAADLTARRRSG